MINFDAPPRPILEQWLPELVDSYDAVQEAQTAVQEARAAVAAARPSIDTVRTPGADWAAAQAQDDALVEQGKPAKHCAALVADLPRREQQAATLERRRDRLIADWNQQAHRRVADETPKAVWAAELDTRSDCLTTAQQAIQAASTGPAADRITESLSKVAELRRQLARWRELRALQGWISWDRPVPSGRAWDPVRYATAVPLDDALRTSGDRGRPDLDTISIGVCEEALALSDDKLRRQLSIRRKADGKELVRP